MTHSDLVFLTSSDHGVRRALRDGDSGWSVETLLPGTKITCLAEDPSRAGVLYAGAGDGGVWRSDDHGSNWVHLGQVDKAVMSLAVSPHDAELIYAGAKAALMFASRDGGVSWSELEGFRRIPNRWWWFSPADPPDWRPYVIAIAISPTEPNILLAGIEFGGVVRSEDGGQTWSRHRRGALRDCHSLKFHAADGDFVYQAGGTGGGAAFSRDGGRRFRKAKRGLAKNYGIACAADPADPTIWYSSVARSPGVAYGDAPKAYLYRAGADAGWEQIGWAPHPLRETPTALVTLPDAPGHLYAGLRNGDVWHSPDYGDHWEKLLFNLGAIWHSLVICKRNPGAGG